LVKHGEYFDNLALVDEVNGVRETTQQHATCLAVLLPFIPDGSFLGLSNGLRLDVDPLQLRSFDKSSSRTWLHGLPARGLAA
jgi:hypothetical protein